MAKTMKKLLGAFLGICILISCTGCDDAKISALAIKDVPLNTIQVGTISDELMVEVEYFRSFQTGDVNVAIEDDTIIKIEYEAKESMLSGYYVSYTIRGLKAGTTSFYFVTTDGTVKSNVVEIEVVDSEPSTNENPSDNTEAGDNQKRTFEVVRKFVEIYNERIDPDIVDTEEAITEDRILKYDDAYSIKGNIEGEYILVMNFGAMEPKNEMRIDTFCDTPEDVLAVLCNVSTVINKSLIDEDVEKTKQYLAECFGDSGKGYTEWTNVGSIKFFSRYLSQGKTYELQIEFPVDTFFE